MVSNQVKEKLSPSSEDLRNDAVNKTVSKGIKPVDLDKFLEEVYTQFIINRVEEFPKLCAETRRVNTLKRNHLLEIGNQGGWSPDKSFKFDYEIPTELYSFMVNLVYKNFWEEDCEKHWRPFLDSIMKGEDPEALLVRTKQAFGSNKDLSLIT